jgi:uncharacterized protein YdeI (YjbR/CyaY-like superfamily)
MGLDDLPQTHVETREAWRAWLEAEHAASKGTWLVSWKQHTGRPAVGYDASVEEALCFGWVDSLVRKLDEDRSMLLFTPRKPTSNWSRPNKQRVERLIAEGRMTPAGLALVEEAKRRGTWTALDEVEDGVVPDDLAEAFDRHPGSREQWDGFPRGVRRGILEWILNAKRPETRAKRLEETASLAARGERANQWPRPRR